MNKVISQFSIEYCEDENGVVTIVLPKDVIDSVIDISDFETSAKVVGVFILSARRKWVSIRLETLFNVKSKVMNE